MQQPKYLTLLLIISITGLFTTHRASLSTHTSGLKPQFDQENMIAERLTLNVKDIPFIKDYLLLNHASNSTEGSPTSEQPCNYQGWLELDRGLDETPQCFDIDQDGYVHYLGEKLYPALGPYEQGIYTVTYVSPLSPSGRYAILRVSGYETPAAVIDTQQNQLVDMANPILFVPWVAWTGNEQYGFIFHPDDGGAFDSILRIDLSNGNFERWRPTDLIEIPLNEETGQYYTLDIETFAIAEDDSQFSIDMTIYENRYTSTPQEQLSVDVDIEGMETISSTPIAGE
ncbi:MAG: hypothetical protein AAFW84_29455 [Cyanobacteria bacterium J06635_15]